MIQLKNISKSYGSKQLFKGLNLTVPAQDKIALVGANGAGKTTLFNLLCRLEEADLGEVIYPQNTRIGYLPQEPNSHPENTILEERLSGNGYMTA